MQREQATRLLALAREAKLTGPDAAGWVERLTPVRQDLGEAARFLTGTGEAEAAVELVSMVYRLWLLAGDVAGGRQVLAAVLDVGERKPSRARAIALYGSGLLAFRAGDMPDSKGRNEQALEVARVVGDREAEALALVGLSRVALRDHDYSRVLSLAGQARELTRDLDPAAGVWPLHLLATGTRLTQNYDEAHRLYSESLQLNRRLGSDGMVGMELFNLGFVELHRGNTDTAERCFAESVTLRGQSGPYDIAVTHLSDAALAAAHGERDRAAQLLDRASATLQRAGIVLDPDDSAEVEWLRKKLGSSAR